MGANRAGVCTVAQEELDQLRLVARDRARLDRAGLDDLGAFVSHLLSPAEGPAPG